MTAVLKQISGVYWDLF